MKRMFSALCSIVWSALPLTAHANAIYKCSGGERPVAYQSVPCADGLRQEMLALGAQPGETAAKPATNVAGAVREPSTEHASEADATPARFVARAAPHADRGVLFRQHALNLGMTDDEVLNLRGWGRPASITRSRAGRVWREEWLYDRGRLRFENARLIEVDV